MASEINEITKKIIEYLSHSELTEDTLLDILDKFILNKEIRGSTPELLAYTLRPLFSAAFRLLPESPDILNKIFHAACQYDGDNNLTNFLLKEKPADIVGDDLAAARKSFVDVETIREEILQNVRNMDIDLIQDDHIELSRIELNHMLISNLNERGIFLNLMEETYKNYHNQTKNIFSLVIFCLVNKKHFIIPKDNIEANIIGILSKPEIQFSTQKYYYKIAKKYNFDAVIKMLLADESFVANQKFELACKDKNIPQMVELLNHHGNLIENKIEAALKQLFEELEGVMGSEDSKSLKERNKIKTMIIALVNLAKNKNLSFSLDWYTKSGSTPLYLALVLEKDSQFVFSELVSEDVTLDPLVQALAKAGANPNFPNWDVEKNCAFPPLMLVAVRNKDYAIAATLYKMGANPFLRENIFSAFSILASRDHPVAEEIFSRILEKTPIEYCLEENIWGGNQLLYDMVEHRAAKNLKQLLQKFPELVEEGAPALINAIRISSLPSDEDQHIGREMLQTLIDSGVPLREKIDRGMPWNENDERRGLTPIEFAASLKLDDIVTILTDKAYSGAEPSSVGVQRFLIRDRLEKLRLAHSKSAHSHWAPESHRDTRTMQVLFQSLERLEGNELKIVNDFPTSEYMEGYLESHSITFNSLQFALKSCCITKNETLARVLIGWGAYPNTLLHYLHKENAPAKSIEFIKKLQENYDLEKNKITQEFENSKASFLAKPNGEMLWRHFQDSSRSKLMRAIVNNDEEKVLELIKMGVDPNYMPEPQVAFDYLPSDFIRISHSRVSINVAGLTPLHLACTQGSPKMFSLLLKAGAGIENANDISQIVYKKPLKELSHFPQTQAPLLKHLIRHAEMLDRRLKGQMQKPQ